MKIKFNDDRTTLTITANRAERRALKKMGEMIHQDATMRDQLEHATSINDLAWINPDETGDLTSAPMLGIYADASTLTKPVISARWAFMDYQVRSVLEDLRDTGEAVFVGGSVK